MAGAVAECVRGSSGPATTSTLVVVREVSEAAPDPDTEGNSYGIFRRHVHFRAIVNLHDVHFVRIEALFSGES